MSDVMIRLEQASTDAVEWMRKNMEYVKDIDGERDQLKADLAKLQAEREPRDNGDGTVTALLPVTYPKGMDVVEVRSRKAGDMFAHWNGERVAVDRDGDPENVWLILRPAPKPPEPVTWEANLGDGTWIAGDCGIQDTAYEFRTSWGTAECFVLGLRRPKKLGTYQFKDGVGTLIQEAGNE